MCTTKRYHLTTIFGITAYDTPSPLCKSGLAQQLLPYAQQAPGRQRVCTFVKATGEMRTCGHADRQRVKHISLGLTEFKQWA